MTLDKGRLSLAPYGELIITAQCYAERGIAAAKSSACPSVCPSVKLMYIT